MDIKWILISLITLLGMSYVIKAYLGFYKKHKRFKEWAERDKELTRKFLLATSTGDIEEAKRVHKELDILLKEYSNNK